MAIDPDVESVILELDNRVKALENAGPVQNVDLTALEARVANLESVKTVSAQQLGQAILSALQSLEAGEATVIDVPSTANEPQ